MAPIRSVCVYCGSSPGRSPVYVQAGLALGRAIGDAGLRLVYGGGSKGVMGAVAEGVRAAGGAVTGIIPDFLVGKEAPKSALRDLDEVLVLDNMHQRKQMMFDRSDAFVALPGGLGTLEEIVEIMTWAQLGRHAKPIVLANIEAFWTPMVGLLDHMRAEGFIHAGSLVRPLVIDRVGEIVPAIRASAPAGDAEGDGAIIGKM